VEGRANKKSKKGNAGVHRLPGQGGVNGYDEGWPPLNVDARARKSLQEKDMRREKGRSGRRGEKGAANREPSNN